MEPNEQSNSMAGPQLTAALIGVGLLVFGVAALGIFITAQSRARMKKQKGVHQNLSVSLKSHLLDNVSMTKETKQRPHRGVNPPVSRSGSSSDSGTYAGSNIQAGSRHLSSAMSEEMVASEDSDVLASTNLGLLEFTVAYESAQHSLMVTIVRCLDLPAKDGSHGTSDPYVKLQLLPDKKHRVKTNLVYKSLNPTFNETFTFPNFTAGQLKTSSLHFVVLSYDRFSRDEVIGEFICPLDSLKLDRMKEANIVKEIMPRELKLDPIHGRGDLLVSLCHQAMTKKLTVVVLKARNLAKMNVTAISADPYVRLCLFNGLELIGKKKSHVQRHTSNPVYNETFTFDLPQGENLSQMRLELNVVDWDRVTKSEILGRVELSLRSGSEVAAAHWKEIMQNSCKQVAEWHALTE